MKMIDKINEGRERRAYKKYAKLNARRKAKEHRNPLFKVFDDARRRTGYVK